MSKWHGGKGDKPRPIEDRKQFENNWDRIFGKKKEEFDEDLTLGKVHEDGLEQKKWADINEQA